ncbi:hypothetical protein [Halobacteriovorax sp. JY17]|uniref:hypothetical protein n=1 Tax=Halobacteriovorax sp. JY17 TaxID=2014617 RepID=UPI000C4EB9E5|nr:hypothetical protein [Halobacteriovorax sp. JY17]PIK15801.1 MAG: hypothetical protein CES88_03475 [Halobacteriovorax sp. JY17]
MKEFSEIYIHAPHWEDIVELKRREFLRNENSLSLEDISIEVHNATWCPDCEREITGLMALILLSAEKPILKIYSYENREEYRSKKLSGLLSTECLPTIIFKKNEVEITRVLEDSKGRLLELLNSLAD